MTTETLAPGYHALLDFWECKGLTDIAFIQKAMEDAAHSCGATILQTKLHSFGEGSGVTGVSILAESHISIHTWPEINFAALDIFVCGNCNVEKAVETLKQHFQPREYTIKKHNRGIKKQQ